MRLDRAGRALIRWICGVAFRERVSSSEVRSRFGLKGTVELICDKRLRRFGHIGRSGEDSSINKSTYKQSSTYHGPSPMKVRHLSS